MILERCGVSMGVDTEDASGEGWRLLRSLACSRSSNACRLGRESSGRTCHCTGGWLIAVPACWPSTTVGFSGTGFKTGSINSGFSGSGLWGLSTTVTFSGTGLSAGNTSSFFSGSGFCVGVMLRSTGTLHLACNELCVQSFSYSL